MAALLASSRMQSSFLGASVRQNGCFTARRACPCSVVIRAAHGDIPKIGGGKKWVHTPVNKNGKPIKVTMHVKKGDLVQVVAGADKGTVAEITDVLTKKGMVVVKGVNIKIKNVSPKTKDEQGQQKKLEFPIHHSNVMHYSKTAEARSRVGHKVTEAGKKVRYLIKTGEIID
eukprot:jgi/Chrzof1/3955/Cz13g14230.t1